MKMRNLQINTPQTFRDKAYFQRLWERKGDERFSVKEPGESEENVVPSIQQKAWRVAKKNTSLKLHAVDGRTPANQLIWRICHYLQGFFTSQVVVGDF